MASKIVGKVDVNLFLSKFEFKWEIDQFCTSCYNVGDCLLSPKFMTYSAGNDIQWYLRLYPNGDDITDAENHLSLYLHCVRGEINAKVVFKFLDVEGGVLRSFYMKEHKFGYWGFQKCLSRDFMMNPVNRMINGNKITIVCEITIRADNKEVIELNKQVLEEREVNATPQQDLADKYEALLNDSKFSDVSLIAEGKTLKVHKCILAKSSPVFAAMFDVEMKEKQKNTVEIADIDYDVLMEMVRYVYTGKVNGIDALVGELTIAADKYALNGLKDMCEMTLAKNLSVENVIVCLQLADKLCMEKLKKKAIDFIVEKGIDVTEKSEFRLLSHDILCKVCTNMAKRRKL